MAARFTFGSALSIVFKHLNESPATLAEFYIDRDRTLVYKWLRDTASPSKKLIPSIVRFVCENAGEPARIQIKTALNDHISQSALSDELKAALTNASDFKSYLEGVFSIAIAQGKAPAASEPTAPKAPDSSTAAMAVSAPVQAALVPVRTPIAIRSFSVLVLNIVLAVLCAVVGGVLWNTINLAFGWPYHMGGSGNEPSGLIAFVWGVVAISPIIIFALLSLLKESPKIACFKKFKASSLLACYAFGGGAAGLLFYNSGFRAFVERFAMAHALQEIIIVAVYSLVISFVPVLAILLLMRLPKIKPIMFFGLEFFSTLMCVLAVLLTVLINRPETEIAQLRGFLVGFILKLTMFISIRAILKGYPSNISFMFPPKSRTPVE